VHWDYHYVDKATNGASWGDGVYEGQISFAGDASGTNYEMLHPNAKVNWFTAPFPCKAPPPAFMSEVAKLKFGKKEPADAAGRPANSVIGTNLSTGSDSSPPSPSSNPIIHIGRSTQTSAPVGIAAPTCKQGFVWRESRPQDFVCVSPASRSMAAQENALAGSRRNPAGGYGPDTCVSGFVWREAFDGDHTCVVPARREAVHQENAIATQLVQ
jgi:hypothetical protein